MLIDRLFKKFLFYIPTDFSETSLPKKYFHRMNNQLASLMLILKANTLIATKLHNFFSREFENVFEN